MEKFYVYKTNACGKDWDTPDNGSNCIAFKNKATGNWLTVDNSQRRKVANFNPQNLDEVMCINDRAGE